MDEHTNARAARKNAPPDVILFDLGGVLVEWDAVEPLIALCRRPLGRDEARRFWLESPWVRAFESGSCDADAFAAGVVAELSLGCSPAEFLAAFTSWDRGPSPGALELLDELAPRFFLACLSNNNAIHWSRLRDEFGLGARFRRCYISYETGKFKPDAAAFHHVRADLGVTAERILFLDDNPECVRAARGTGMEAQEAHGVAGTRAILVARGLLPR